MWQRNTREKDTEIYYDLYFFDIQNPDEILQGAKPIVVEMGPYAYREWYYKFDISWKDDGNKVSYNTWKYYTFDESRTGPGLSEDDELMLSYPSVIGFEYLLGEIPEVYQQMLEVAIIAKINAQEVEIEAQVQELYDALEAQFLPPRKKQELLAELRFVNMSIHTYFDDMYTFVEQSNPANLLLKTMLCGLESGVSPFWKVQPGPAWFGWLHDPLLEEVQLLLDIIEMKTGEVTPWSTAVPGAAVNYTSIDDARRRRANDLQFTGKKNVNQVGQYIRYSNMSSYWSCVASMDSPQAPDYDPATMFPACAHFQNDWTDAQAEAMGYVQPWATPYANRIEGTDAQMYGRPVTSRKIQVFISDIYRSAYTNREQVVDWHGIQLNRMVLQEKDLYNATENPENAQYYQFGPKGLENTTKATGIPVFVSFPHFLYGDANLQGAITGLSANPTVHQSYLDVEPQSGALIRAEKKLQVNYLMSSDYLPMVSNQAVSIAHGICNNISGLVEALQENGIDTGNITDLDCNLTQPTALLTCWAQPSDWQLQNGGSIYMPYGYVNEHFSLSADDAQDMKDSLYFIDDLAKSCRFWCLLIAGICFTVQMAIVMSAYFEEKALHPLLHHKRTHSHMDGASTHEPLLKAEANANRKAAAVVGAGQGGTTTQDSSYSFQG